MPVLIKYCFEGRMCTMIRTVLNGDDFGISEEVNRAIAECFEKRLLTSTTLMVNMPYADQAVEIAREEGFAEAVGLHLNLTSGYPLTRDIRKCRRFCRKNGSFNAYFQQHTSSRLFLTKKERRAAAKEIEAQMRKYFSYGLPERHLDSHHHVHTDRAIMLELMPLMHKYDFRSVRLSRNLFKKMNPLKKLYKHIFNSKLKKSGLITTEFFGSYRDLAAMNGEIRDNAMVEVMLHPMYNEDGVLCDTKTPMSEVGALLDSLKAEREPYSVVKER